MKLSHLSFLVAWVTGSLAQDPSNCSGGGSRNGADFVLQDQGDNSHHAALAKVFANAGQVVPVGDVFADANHKLTSASGGKKAWPAGSFDDQNTAKWIPQGITSTADSLEAGTVDGVDGLLVSWYRGDGKGARVTFINKADYSYRHVLLVYPFSDNNFREVPIHAGGLMWYGNTLWVVDTANGIRVFDMSNIWKVSTGDGVGRQSDGTYTAAGYKYVLPQIRWYKWTPDFNFRFSYLALDRTASPDRVLVGEYQSDTSLPIRMVQWELDYTTRKLKFAQAVWAYCVGIRSIQGAVQANKKIYISRSNGASGKGDIFGWTPGKAAYNNAGIVPRGTEDLSFDTRDGTIYGLTEYAGDRYLYFLKSSDIRFS